MAEGEIESVVELENEVVIVPSEMAGVGYGPETETESEDPTAEIVDGYCVLVVETSRMEQKTGGVWKKMRVRH